MWIYETTGSATLFALSMLVYVLPTIIFSPLAGVASDRYDRRLVMIFSDSLAACGTTLVLVMVLTGHLQVWHVYIAAFLGSTANTFQWPAYSAATSLLVPKQHLGRASGMVQAAEAASQLIAPAAAGALYVTAGLKPILLIDLATFGVALATLAAVSFPQPERTEAGKQGSGPWWREALFGWQYIHARPGLFGLLIVFAISNFCSNLAFPLLAPMLLDQTTPDQFGFVMSAFGLGALAGTLIMSGWGGPKRRIYGIVIFDALAGLFGVMLGLSRAVPLIAAVGFMMAITFPITNGCSQAIWQSKVAQDVQGRVFAARRMMAFSIIPISYILAGPLAEHVFNPLLLAGGSLAATPVGWLVGVGPGRGTGLLFVLAHLGYTASTLSILALRHVRRVEDELPDAVGEAAQVIDEAPVAEAVPAG